MEIANGNTTVNVYNTIISGNTADGSGNDLHVAAGPGIVVKRSYIIGADVYNASGGSVATAFDPATMLGPLADNGGKTQTVALLGVGPALDHGMPQTDLENVGDALGVDADITANDQRGISRAGKTAIGAWVNE